MILVGRAARIDPRRLSCARFDRVAESSVDVAMPWCDGL
ncbi:Hypothetical protein A7982_03746 [Minicystis rosea]|nr:Hypothetical protein A7982_03746 [Minicystis rosea]